MSGLQNGLGSRLALSINLQSEQIEVYGPAKSGILAQEDSIFQRFVVGPRSKQQMIWSVLGTLWIVWDLSPAFYFIEAQSTQRINATALSANKVPMMSHKQMRDLPRITIPLGLFQVEDFIQFMSAVARVSSVRLGEA